MFGAAVQTQPQTTGPSVYRPRRPAGTLLHKTVRENLETYLAARQDGDITADVPCHVQAAGPDEWPEMDQTAGAADNTWD